MCFWCKAGARLGLDIKPQGAIPNVPAFVLERSGRTVGNAEVTRERFTASRGPETPLAGAADAGCYGISIDFRLETLARQGIPRKPLLLMAVDLVLPVFIGVIVLRGGHSFKTAVQTLASIHAKRPPRERLRSNGVLGSQQTYEYHNYEILSTHPLPEPDV
jgi:hypothetical protein